MDRYLKVLHPGVRRSEEVLPDPSDSGSGPFYVSRVGSMGGSSDPSGDGVETPIHLPGSPSLTPDASHSVR